ncbi:hypothetical protein LSCM4_02348 [Leishmania orientalis]|uniref:Uncharacterized protein n=1 Tax=Leishmania orientalis TaxID=2249476 RepID=A0A836H238_9TRYP|nr:hypothetical protein LSCM4_02348 [Leishmania orientalis]
MSGHRGVVGYSKMVDYYDSDYVPYDLLARCHTLQVELRKRREQQLSALSQGSGFAVDDDDAAVAPSLAQLRAHSSSSSRCVNQHQQQVLPWSMRSPHRVMRRGSNSLGERASGVQRMSRRGSTNGNIPRRSLVLEETYAARERSRSGAFGGGTLAHDSGAYGSSARRNASSSASSSSGALPDSARQGCNRQKARRRRLPTKAKNEALTSSDPYEAAAEARRQEQFLSENKRLGKPFVPSGNSGLGVPTRFMLGDCVKMLYRSIAPDWQVATPVVVSTAEDLIAIYFSLAKLSKEQVTALLQYMNGCLKHNDAVREFNLSKVDEGWDVLTNDGHILYTLRPPWVKKRAFLPYTVTPPHAHMRYGGKREGGKGE